MAKIGIILDKITLRVTVVEHFICSTTDDDILNCWFGVNTRNISSSTPTITQSWLYSCKTILRHLYGLFEWTPFYGRRVTVPKSKGYRG